MGVEAKRKWSRSQAYMLSLPACAQGPWRPLVDLDRVGGSGVSVPTAPGPARLARSHPAGMPSRRQRQDQLLRLRQEAALGSSLTPTIPHGI